MQQCSAFDSVEHSWSDDLPKKTSQQTGNTNIGKKLTFYNFILFFILLELTRSRRKCGT